ncbi:MAG: OmpH family outer membrane protein [Alphaproteobacteria bacterium]|nr:OmpH family outer membrane protein [Alphaproteobacteria bacterium]
MKFTALFAVLAAAITAYTPFAFADDAATTKPTIAVVNIQQVMRDSTAAKSVREQLESKQKSYQAELSKKDESLRKEEADLKKQQGILSKDAFEKKVAEFRKKATEVQKEVQTKKASLDGAFEGALAEIQKTVSEIISDMAKEKGFSVAVPTAQVLYADTKLDISADVLAALNKKLTKVDVKFDSKSK